MAMKAALFALLCVLQVADVALTVAILRRGGRELNPLLARLMKAVGELPALVLVKAAMLGVVLFFYAAIPEGLLAAACAVYVYVCFLNWREFKK